MMNDEHGEVMRDYKRLNQNIQFETRIVSSVTQNSLGAGSFFYSVGRVKTLHVFTQYYIGYVENERVSWCVNVCWCL